MVQYTMHRAIFLRSYIHTSLRRDGSFGRAIRAIPLQTTATSSTKTQSGEFSSGGISTTSISSSRKSCARAKCWVLASSSVTSPRVRSDSGILHRIACVYRCSGILGRSDRPHVPRISLPRTLVDQRRGKKGARLKLEFDARLLDRICQWRLAIGTSRSDSSLGSFEYKAISVRFICIHIICIDMQYLCKSEC